MCSRPVSLYFILLLAICSVVIYGWCFYLHDNLRRLNIFLIAVLVFGLRIPLGTAIALDDAIILELIGGLVLRSSSEYADHRQRDEQNKDMLSCPLDHFHLATMTVEHEAIPPSKSVYEAPGLCWQ